MTRLRADVVWRVEGAHASRLDERLLDLLRALQRNATLRAAAAELDLSYRAAWGMLLDAAALLGTPLVDLQRGRGARLSALGSELLRNDERLRKAMVPLRARFEIAAAPPRGDSLVPLRLVASHDPLLAEFCERCAVPAGLIGDVSFRGSEDALAAYARGAADLAGFHFGASAEAVQLRRYLKPGRDLLVRFAEREQGLLLASGNPKRLTSLEDVAARGARFVNRQRGSGTRALVDRLLREAKIAPEQIPGYGTEEFTHLAVAATIAARRADAGFGVRAAAAQLGLDFVPVLRERYWIAVREPTAVRPAAQRLLDALAERPMARIARRMPGYVLDGAGTLCDIGEVFP